MAIRTTTITERRQQRPSGARRTAAALCALAAVTAGCGGDDATPERVGADEVVMGELHECAAGLPVPEEMVVDETALGRDQGGGRTCVVTLVTEADVANATTSYLAALDAEGWDYEVQQLEEQAAIVNLVGPACGVVLVLPEQAGTTAMVSLFDCDRVREQPPAPTVGDG